MLTQTILTSAFDTESWSLAERYADEHASEFAPNDPPRAPMSDLGKLVFDTANAMNTAIAAQLRREETR